MVRANEIHTLAMPGDQQYCTPALDSVSVYNRNVYLIYHSFDFYLQVPRHLGGLGHGGLGLWNLQSGTSEGFQITYYSGRVPAGGPAFKSRLYPDKIKRSHLQKPSPNCCARMGHKGIRVVYSLV